MFDKYILLVWLLNVSIVFAQQSERVNLGDVQTGTTFSFVRNTGDQWGIEIAGGDVLCAAVRSNHIDGHVMTPPVSTRLTQYRLLGSANLRQV